MLLLGGKGFPQDVLLDCTQIMGPIKWKEFNFRHVVLSFTNSG